eukprot:Rmarinus@m.1341
MFKRLLTNETESLDGDYDMRKTNWKDIAYFLRDNIRGIVLFGTPIFALPVLFWNPSEEDAEATAPRVAYSVIIMALYWCFEPIPIAITSIIPVVLFPMLGIMSASRVSSAYFNDTMFLFMGSYIVAIAVERWRLHERIALRLLMIAGTGTKQLLFGFMLASWFLSMLINNTATTAMMLPIAQAVLQEMYEDVETGNQPAELDSVTIEEESKSDAITTGTLKTRAEEMKTFREGVALGVAYASSIGGLSTLTGTQPNLIFIGLLEDIFPASPSVSYMKWLSFGLPLSAVMLVLTWMLFVWGFCPRNEQTRNHSGVSATFERKHNELGDLTSPRRRGELLTCIVFATLAGLWLSRAQDFSSGGEMVGWANLFEEDSDGKAYVTDGTAACAMAILLFIIPSSPTLALDKRLLTWEYAKEKIPWGVMLLFGGGFALSRGFSDSRLDQWLGAQLEGLEGVSRFGLVLTICTMVTFLTEFTSNTATSQIILPILATLAVAIDMDPLLLMVPATLACSLAFMLPVSTPPNAVAFSTGYVKIPQMIRFGFVLNILGTLLIPCAMLTYGIAVYDIETDGLPDWAKN